MLHVLRIPIKNQTRPVAIQQEEAGVGLEIVLNTKLDKRFVLELEIGNQPLNDAIFTKLGVDLKLHIGESIYLRKALDLERGEATAQTRRALIPLIELPDFCFQLPDLCDGSGYCFGGSGE